MNREVIHHRDGDPRNNTISNLEIRAMPAEAFTVHRSIARRVQIGPFAFAMTAEDWPDVKACEAAATRAGELLRIYHPAFTGQEVTGILDDLADRIMGELGIPAGCAWGCALIAEPL